MDLGAWLAEWRFRALLELIEQLPRASRYAGAVMNDPEQAEIIARQRAELDDDKDGNVPRSLPWHEFDLHAEMQRDLIHDVRLLIDTIARSFGGSPAPIREYPAPVTAVDKAIAQLERAWTDSILTRYGFSASDL